MRTKRTFLSAGLLVLGILLLAELLARTNLPDVPDSRDAPRNPFRYRGWPEYMSGIRKSGEKPTVVLLTNCQAYGGEYPASKGYPAALEHNLSERSAGECADWDVLNWAIDGATSMEYMLMATHLRKHPPRIVLAVTGYGDYHNEHYREGISYCRSDIPRLLSRWSILRLLPQSFRRRHVKIEDWLSFALSDHLALLRFKEFTWSWLDRRLPGIHNVFYAPAFNHLPWALPKHPLIKPLRLKKRSDSAMEVTYGEESRQMLREYIQQLSGIPSRVIVVAEPTTISGSNPFVRSFLDDLESMTMEHGLVYWDLHDALPAENFLTSSHLHRKNHLRMADILADRMSSLLDKE